MAATSYKPIPYKSEILEAAEMVRRGRQFFELMSRRRSVRDFSTSTPARSARMPHPVVHWEFWSPDPEKDS